MLLWNWSLQLEISLGSQSLSTMCIWKYRNRNFGSVFYSQATRKIQVEDDQICQGGKFLRGESATGIKQPCTMGLFGGPSQGMSSSPGRQMRGWRIATRGRKQGQSLERVAPRCSGGEGGGSSSWDRDLKRCTSCRCLYEYYCFYHHSHCITNYLKIYAFRIIIGEVNKSPTLVSPLYFLR